MGLEDYKTILYRQEDGSWVAEIPALPGCYALMPTREEALAELVSHKGTGFDPAVVQAFEEAYCNGMVESIRERFPTPRYHSLQPASTQ